MMGLIVAGVIIFGIVEAIDERIKRKGRKPKIINTHLTDYELRPIEKQDLDYDDAIAYFNTAVRQT